jgi:hypothetical protein
VSTADDDDLFDAIERKHGLLPPNDYCGEFVVAVPYSTKRTNGQEAVIRIAEGRYTDRLLRLRFLTDGPASLDGLIANNAAILLAWWEALCIEGRPPRSEGFDGMFKTLWQAGQGKRLIFTIDTRISGKFSENVLTRVEWEVEI